MPPAAGEGRARTKVVLPENGKSSRPPKTTVPVLKLYTRKRKIQPAAEDDRSSTKVVLPENGKSSRPPETAVPVLKLYYQRTENPTGRRRRPFQY